MDSKPNKISDRPITSGEWIGLLLTPLIIGLLHGVFMRNDVAFFMLQLFRICLKFLSVFRP